MEYLYEIGRIKADAHTITGYLPDRIGLQRDNIDFLELIQSSIVEKWTRDPFDRVLVAHARLRSAPLISLDKTIRRHYKKTIV